MTPNDHALPPYATLNLSLDADGADQGHAAARSVRFDVLNCLDSQLSAARRNSGVGVGAPQFGMRRSFLVGLSQKF